MFMISQSVSSSAFQYKRKHFKRKGNGEKIMFLNPKSQISGIFKKSIIDFKGETYRLWNAVKCNNNWEQTSEEDLVSTSHSRKFWRHFCEFVSARRKIALIKQLLCYISKTEFCVFHCQGTLETKIIP